MKIKHTTHDAAPGRPRRSSIAARKFVDFFSVKIHGYAVHINEGDQEPLIQPTLTPRPVMADEQLNICSTVMFDEENKNRCWEQKAEDNARRHVGGEKPRSKTSILDGKASQTPPRKCILPLAESRAQTLNKSKGRPQIEGPALSRSNSSPHSSYQKPIRSDGLAQLHRDRLAILAGDLEKVVPPTSPLPQNPFLSPPPARLSFFSTSSGSTSSISPPQCPNHKRSESTTSKLSSYVLTSADILDSTRRDLASHIRRSAERAFSSTLDYHQRQDLLDDGDSDDESFFCVGEHGSDENDHRRLSGEGTNPWVHGLQDDCRLCHRKRPAGLKGLCEDCEIKFKQPKTLKDDDEAAGFYVVKPIPPLKIKKQASSVSETSTIDWTYDPFFDEHEPPVPPRKDVPIAALGLNIENVQTRPKIVTQLRHQPSQHAIIQDISTSPLVLEKIDDRTQYEMWQTTEIRREYKRNEEEYVRWSANLSNDDDSENTGVGEEAKTLEKKTRTLRSKFNTTARNMAVKTAASLEGTDNLKNSLGKVKGLRRRDTSFYRFYDEVLGDHGANNHLPPATKLG